MASSPPDHSWGYSHDASFSDPVNSQRILRLTSPAQPVALHPDNMQPDGGFEAALNSAPSNGRQTKIIYTLRHGNTGHNEDSRIWGKPVAWRYLSGLRKNFNPEITEEGVQNTATAARYLSENMRYRCAPRPLTVYSSPLRRCIETAMHMIKQAGLHQPRPDDYQPPVKLHVKEGLREWMGYGHGHQSDRKGSKAEIQQLIEQLKAELGVDVEYHLDVTEQEEFYDEVYVDVDWRVRGVLDDMFNDPYSGHCVMLVMHSRCNKSLLRVLGHPPAAVDNFEVANCSVLPYRVGRHLLDRGQAAARLAREDLQRHEDQVHAEEKKEERRLEAIADVRVWNHDPNLRYRLDGLLRFLTSWADSGDRAAFLAMRMLEDDLNPPEA